MSRGDKELRCFERVRKKVFPKADASSVEDADRSLWHTSVFGFTPEDWKLLCEIILSAKPNDNPNEFPDFKSDDSLIEHFEISATKENRKGSRFKQKREPFLQSMREELYDVAAAEEPQAMSRCFNYPDSSHQNLLESLKKNLNNHINALKSYDPKPAASVFIIEHQECGLFMIENIYSEFGEDRVFGDMRSPQRYNNYRMSRDREALEILATHEKPLLDFVIFVGVEYIEFIRLSEIPNMLKLMPWPFVVAAGPTTEMHRFLPVMQADAFEKERDNHE